VIASIQAILSSALDTLVLKSRPDPVVFIMNPSLSFWLTSSFISHPFTTLRRGKQGVSYTQSVTKAKINEPLWDEHFIVIKVEEVAFSAQDEETSLPAMPDCPLLHKPPLLQRRRKHMMAGFRLLPAFESSDHALKALRDKKLGPMR
jgi:hypothetical protein